jgi:hypothetical protein
MVSQQNRLIGTLLVFGLVGGGLAGCSSSSESPGGSGGGGNSSSGSSSSTSTGGSSATGGTVASGGSVASGGTKSSGGTQETGGTIATGGSNSGGTKATGGTSSSIPATGGSSASSTGTGGSTSSGAGGSSSGTGGSPMGGTSGTGNGGSTRGGATGGGGRTGTGGSTMSGTGGTTGSGTGGTTGSGTGGSTSSSGCVKGVVKAKDVVIMGESFYAMSPQYIQKRIESKAKAAGVIGSGDSYRNVAVSGQTMNYVATTEWNSVQSSPPKVVIMDGGGIDCMSSSCSSCPGDFKTLLGKMATAGVQDVIYTRYPEPGAPPGSNATLKGNLDILMPKMQPVCEGATGLKCHWVDLRPVWVTGDTTDGLHPTTSGGDHVGDLIWSEMVKDCIAQ